MIPDVEARDRIIADADADPRLPTQRAKCRVYRGLLANVLSKADYPHVGKLGCEAFPLDAVAPKAEGNR